MRLRLFIALALLATNAQAWPLSSVERIAKKGSDLAPRDLRLLIEKYTPEYRDGFAVDEGQEARHTYIVETRRGALPSMIKNEVGSAVKMLRERQPMHSVVEKLGLIAHLVADANNPFHVANSDRRLIEKQPDFEGYFDRKLAKFPTVFYGLERPFNLESYLDATLNRTASYYPLLSEEYFRHGERRSSSDFDDRSTAFGIASLSYSHAVTDVVNIYFYIWKEAGGDVRSASVMQRGNLLLNPSYED